MNTDYQYELMHAASLLTKAASMLEYAENLKKEAAAASATLINKGVAANDQHEFYTDYFMKNPEKIASMKLAFNDLPINNSSGALGEVAGGYTADANAMDLFDKAVLG